MRMDSVEPLIDGVPVHDAGLGMSSAVSKFNLAGALA